LLALLFDPEDWGDMFPWNISWRSPHYTELYPRRNNPSYLPLWEIQSQPTVTGRDPLFEKTLRSIKCLMMNNSRIGGCAAGSRVARTTNSGYSHLYFAKSCFYHSVAACLKGMYSYSFQQSSPWKSEGSRRCETVTSSVISWCCIEYWVYTLMKEVGVNRVGSSVVLRRCIYHWGY
jgi:hypothetical protein